MIQRPFFCAARLDSPGGFLSFQSSVRLELLSEEYSVFSVELYVVSESRYTYEIFEIDRFQGAVYSS